MTIFETHRSVTCCEHCGDKADAVEEVHVMIINRARIWYHLDCWEALQDAFPVETALLTGGTPR